MPTAAPEPGEVAEEHRAWVGRSDDCSCGRHREPAALDLADPRSHEHDERRAPGLAQYVHDAVQANTDRAQV